MGPCGSCGTELVDGIRFCPACGAAINFEGPERRRIVTILFADMVDSTALGERLDPELLRSVQSRYFAALREPIERHGGTVEKYIGDAVMAVFGIPIAHEDDALRAVRAASELRPALARLAADLRERYGFDIEIRVGLNTGEVVATEGATSVLATGDAINTAARLQGAALPGEIFLGPATYDLVRDAVTTEPMASLHLRGKAEPIAAHRLQTVLEPEAQAKRWNAPTVGRERELMTLAGALAEAARDRSARLVTILAPAGVGKSRLIRAFADQVGDTARVVRGRCLPYGDGITYWAVAEIIRATASITEADPPDTIAARIAATLEGVPDAQRVAQILAVVIGASTEAATADDIAWAFRRLLEQQSEGQPLIVVVEDIHWADPALLDLLETVVAWSDRAPILIVCSSRPDLFEHRSGFAADLPGVTTIALDPLDPSAVGALIDVLPGGSELPADLRRRVVEAAEGNPLFVEEMLGKLVDDQVLTMSDGRWRVAPGTDRVKIPLSIHALLAARIDSLEPPERVVAERASVVGRVFERSAVAAISPEVERGTVDGRLLSLTRKELIRPDGTGLGGDDAFRFRHILIRDAAYDRLTKAERANLHARFAAWLEGVAGERILEYVEIVAHHLWAAVDYRLELGTLADGDGRTLAARAIHRLIEAAGRAERVYAYDEAARLFGRTLDLLARIPKDGRSEGPDQVDLLARRAEALARAGDADVCIEVVRQAIGMAKELGDDIRASLLCAQLASYLHSQGDDSAGLAMIDSAVAGIPMDSPSPARATVLAAKGQMLLLVHRFDDAIGACDEAIGAAWETSSRVDLVSAQISKGSALAAIGQVESGLELLFEARDAAEEMGDGYALGRAFVNISGALESARDPERQRLIADQGTEAASRYGLERSLGVTLLLNRCSVESWDGRPRTTERLARQMLRLGLVGDYAVWANLVLAIGLAEQGRYDEAELEFQTANGLAARGAQESTLIDLGVEHARLGLIRGDWEEARSMLESARSAATAEPQPLAIISLEVCLVELDGAMARAAHRSGDDTTAATAVSRMLAAERRVRAVADVAATRSPGLDWRARAHLAVLDGLVRRGSGLPARAEWEATIVKLRELRAPGLEARAAAWLVEDLVEHSGDAELLGAALLSARAAAKRAEADGLLRDLDALETLSRGRAGPR